MLHSALDVDDSGNLTSADFQISAQHQYIWGLLAQFDEDGDSASQKSPHDCALPFTYASLTADVAHAHRQELHRFLRQQRIQADGIVQEISR